MKKNKLRVLSAFSALLIYITFRIYTGNVLIILKELSLTSEWGIRNLIFALFPYSSWEGLVLLAVFLLLLRAPWEKPKTKDTVFSLLFAFFYLIGYALYKTDRFDILTDRPVCVFFAVIAFFGTALAMLTAILYLRHVAVRLAAWKLPLPAFAEKHSFLFPFAVILVCYLPYVIIRYPAGVEFDAYYQIEQFLGLVPMTAHWPPFSSAFLGSFVWLGKALFGSYNAGLFMLVLVQSIICAAVLAYTVRAALRLGAPKSFCAAMLLVYAISPVFASYLTAVIKDAMFSAGVLMFVCLLAEEVLSERGRLHKLCTGICGLLICLLRNNGIYVLAACLGVLLVYYAVTAIKSKKLYFPMLTVCLLCAVLLNSVYNSVILPAMDIPEGSVREALSVPFQQTARYLKEYPDDVTAEEAEAIAAVLDYENLAALYDPNLSDPVKNTYHGSSEDLLPYFKAWFAQLLRHPGVYFNATLSNANGFYFPDAQNLVFYDRTWSSDQVIYTEPEGLKEAKNNLYDFVALFESLPLLSVIGSTGAQFWVLIYLLFSAASNKKGKRGKLLFLLIPSLVGAAVCLASPTFTVNGVRYALPFIYANPLLISLFAAENKEE